MASGTLPCYATGNSQHAHDVEAETRVKLSFLVSIVYRKCETHCTSCQYTQRIAMLYTHGSSGHTQQIA